jgi:hypothetical protein
MHFLALIHKYVTIIKIVTKIEGNLNLQRCNALEVKCTKLADLRPANRFAEHPPKKRKTAEKVASKGVTVQKELFCTKIDALPETNVHVCCAPKFSRLVRKFQKNATPAPAARENGFVHKCLAERDVPLLVTLITSHLTAEDLILWVSVRII